MCIIYYALSTVCTLFIRITSLVKYRSTCVIIIKDFKPISQICKDTLGMQKVFIVKKGLAKTSIRGQGQFYVFILISSLFFFFFFFTWGTQAQICACFLDPYLIFLFYITLESIDSHKKKTDIVSRITVIVCNALIHINAS